MKIIHCLLNVKFDVTTHGKQHPLFFEREHWQLVENHIYCLVKQQWQHIEIHPLLAKSALTAQGKLHPLISERAQWQHVENQTHYLVYYSDKRKTIHCLLSVHWKHMENQIHCFLREDWQHVETSSTAKWNSTDNVWKSIHCLLNVIWEHTKNRLEIGSSNMWKTYPLLSETAGVAYGNPSTAC